jgi:hypothetical protein
MTSLSFCLPKYNIPTVSFVGFVFMMALHSLSLETPQQLFYGDGFFKLTNAQQPSANSSPINASINSQNKSENMMEAAGHFANNQIRDGVVTWIQGGYWNLQIADISDNGDNNNQISSSSDSSSTANFLANFTMIRPDGSLSHIHIINNFSSNNVVLSDNDIVVTGMADIRSNNGLEYEQVPLIVHLMGKKVLGLTIDVSKTEGHFASPNEMFGTLISGVGINGTNSTSTTMMNYEEPAVSNDSLNETSMTTMKH